MLRTGENIRKWKKRKRFVTKLCYHHHHIMIFVVVVVVGCVAVLPLCVSAFHFHFQHVHIYQVYIIRPNTEKATKTTTTAQCVYLCTINKVRSMSEWRHRTPTEGFRLSIYLPEKILIQSILRRKRK